MYIAIYVEGLACHKARFNPPFFFTSQDYGPTFFFLKFPVQVRRYGSCYSIFHFFVCMLLFSLQFSVSCIQLFSSYSYVKLLP